jgi:F-type H+-transporting ATPase subunit b
MLMDILRDFGVNSTLFIQIVSFLVFLFFMNFILYRPIRKIISQRNAETTSLQESIEGLQSQSNQTEKGIEESRVEARKSGFAEKESLKGEGLEEEQQILQTAGSEVEAKRDKARKEMEVRMAEVRQALEGEIAVFSNDLAEKILGRSA